MSRIGRKPIEIPADVKVSLEDERIIVVGKYGRLEHKIPNGIEVGIENNTIKVNLKDEDKKALWGTTRTVIYNMIVGVSQLHKKVLEIVCEKKQGYQAMLKGNELHLKVGFANPVVFQPPQGIKIEVPNPQKIIVSGVDKVLVGNVASQIKAIKPPDKYKGSGIRYEGEVILLKERKKVTYGAAKQK